MANKCCDTCVFFSVSRTPTGKARQGVDGQCRATMTMELELVDQCKKELTKILPESCLNDVLNFSVWPSWMMPTEGTSCPVWKEKESES